MPLTPFPAGAYLEVAKNRFLITEHSRCDGAGYKSDYETISDRACHQELGDSSSRRFGKRTGFVAGGAVIEMRIISLIHDLV